MRQGLRWLPFIVIAVQIALLVSGVLTLAQTAVVFLILETLLAFVIVGEFALLLRAYRKSHRAGAGRAQAFADALDAVLPRPVAYLVRQEFRIFGAVAGALLRRRAVAAEDQILTYGGHMRGLLIGMIVVSVIEIAVVELLVPWTWLRWTLVILGAYGLLWVIGFAGSAYTRPHTVDARQLRLRFAIFTDIAVPLHAVASASETLGSHQKLVEITDGALAVSVLGLTNITLRLEPAMELDLGRAGLQRVSSVRFYADDPAQACAMIREASHTATVPASDNTAPA